MVHDFTFADEIFIYDSESGAFHQIDEAALSVVQLYQANAGKRPDAVSLADIPEGLEIAAEIDELIALGELFAPRPEVSFAQLYPDKPRFKAMCLNLCHDCNLRCVYCFADTGKYTLGKRCMMTAETGKQAIDFLLENSGNRHNLDIDFFGGEPLLNWQVVKELVAYCETEGPRRGKNIRLTITTNCTLLDEEKTAYINQHFKNCVLSLDGRKAVNDKMRYYADGKGSYDLVSGKIRDFVKARKGKEYYIRGTFTKYNLNFVADVMALADLGDQVSVEPVVAPPEVDYAVSQADLPQALQAYEELAQAMRARRNTAQDFNFFHFMLQEGTGPCLYKRLKGCGVGTEYCAVTPDGEIYPCHQLVGEERYIIGHLSSHGAVIETDKQKPFLDNLMPEREPCNACWARYYCGGGCVANHLHANGDLNKVDPIYCAMLKKRLECALWLSAKTREDKMRALSNS